MYIVIARLAGRDPATDAECSSLHKRIAGIHTPGATICHVYATPVESGMDLVLFVIADTLETAEAVARIMLERALTRAGLDLTIESCNVDLFMPGAEAALGFDPGPDPA
ncbi:hypothetical protein ABIA32_005983 [Streptacidiphilus sp. MAP12-20]|uniref:hypothetical protein n=1 Tax=Streptacidiphilus sp. MAP12-20 TaxID=3156299 RepID=UPI0035193E09